MTLVRRIPKDTRRLHSVGFVGMKEKQRTSHMRFNTVNVLPIWASSVQYVLKKIKNTWNKKIWSLIYEKVKLQTIRKEQRKLQTIKI